MIVCLARPAGLEPTTPWFADDFAGFLRSRAPLMEREYWLEPYHVSSRHVFPRALHPRLVLNLSRLQIL